METQDINFVAIDFETATYDRMACQVGITIVREGKIVDTFEKLIQPPMNRYDESNIIVHHITPEMTRDAPTFDKVWEDISDLIVGKVVVAHNAAFDEDVLYKNLAFYEIPAKGILPFFCTLMLMGHNLTDLCKMYGIDCSEHHDAANDSRCCAQLFLKYLNKEKPKFTVKSRTRTEKDKNFFASKFGKHAHISADLKVKDLTNADPNNPFYDKKVVITGVFSMDRNEIAARLKDMGADINSSISRKTNFVLVGEDAGPSKMKKIADLQSQGYNIVVLHQEDLDRIFNGEWDNYIIKDKN